MIICILTLRTLQQRKEGAILKAKLSREQRSKISHWSILGKESVLLELVVSIWKSNPSKQIKLGDAGFIKQIQQRSFVLKKSFKFLNLIWHQEDLTCSFASFRNIYCLKVKNILHLIFQFDKHLSLVRTLACECCPVIGTTKVFLNSIIVQWENAC